MAKFQSIPWLRIGAESLAIVVSILLAFGIDAWWDVRVDRQIEREYLLALQEEVDRAASELEDDLTRRRQLQTMLSSFLSDGSVDASSFSQMMREALRVSNLSPPTSVMDELVSSGRLQLVRSAEIRQGIMVFRQDMQKNELNDEAHRTFVHTRYIPVLSDNLALNDLVSKTAGRDISVGFPHEDMEMLRDGDRLRNVMIERLYYLERGLGRLRATVGTLKGLSELLEQELD